MNRSAACIENVILDYSPCHKLLQLLYKDKEKKGVVIRALWYQLLSTAKSVGILKHICNSSAFVAENPEPVQACTLFGHWFL